MQEPIQGQEFLVFIPLLLIVARGGADQEAVSKALEATFEGRIAAGELSKWAMPDEIRFVEAIAKTSVGKIDKKALRAGLARSG